MSAAVDEQLAGSADMAAAACAEIAASAEVVRATGKSLPACLLACHLSSRYACKLGILCGDVQSSQGVASVSASCCSTAIGDTPQLYIMFDSPELQLGQRRRSPDGYITRGAQASPR